MNTNGDYRYHVPNQWPQGGGRPPVVLTIEGIDEEVADYMGLAHVCDMANVGHAVETMPGWRGRLVRRWLTGHFDDSVSTGEQQ